MSGDINAAAETIRRFFAECQPVQYRAGAWGPPTDALDALVAEVEQQQARAEYAEGHADRFKQEAEELGQRVDAEVRRAEQLRAERDAAMEDVARQLGETIAAVKENVELRARCEQAIDERDAAQAELAKLRKRLPRCNGTSPKGFRCSKSFGHDGQHAHPRDEKP